MEASKVFTVEVLIEETQDKTDAKATVAIAGNTFAGWGRARRNPRDPNLPQVGEELATARALSDVAHKLLEAAATTIDAHGSEPAPLPE